MQRWRVFGPSLVAVVAAGCYAYDERAAPPESGPDASAIDTIRLPDGGGRRDAPAPDAPDAPPIDAGVDATDVVLDAPSVSDAPIDANWCPPRAVSVGPRDSLDVDGDGSDDLIVGADLQPRVYGFTGAGAVAWTLRGGWGFGYDLAVPGDIDGDAIDDLLVTSRGRVSIYRGGITSPARVAEVEWPGALSGQHFERLGDLDGDGLPEVLVHARDTCDVEIWSFACLPAIERTLVWREPSCFTLLGLEVHAGSDLDGDTRTDFVVTNGVLGTILVFTTTADGATLRQTIPLGHAGGELAAARLSGDLDADGRIDLLVVDDGGRLDVLWGDESGFSWDRSSALPPVISYRIGTRLVAGSDLDGDGLGDAVVGGAQRSGFGVALFVFGARSRVLETRTFVGPRGDFGVPVARLPDMTADGRSDIAVGASYDGVYGPGEVSILSVQTDRSIEVVRTLRGVDGERFGVSVAGL